MASGNPGAVHLREMGTDCDDVSWAVGGSQEVVTRSVRVGNTDVTVEAETYIGLTLSGDAHVVDEIAKCLGQERNLT